jgi:hypothetical protein
MMNNNFSWILLLGESQTIVQILQRLRSLWAYRVCPMRFTDLGFMAVKSMAVTLA